MWTPQPTMMNAISLTEGYNILVDGQETDTLEQRQVIASFFRNIGYAEQLGSGVGNLFKYTKFYSGKEPEFKEGIIRSLIRLRFI